MPGGLVAEEVAEDEEAVMLEFERLISTFHDPGKYSMLRIVLAPVAPMTCSTEFFRKCAVLARQHKGE